MKTLSVAQVKTHLSSLLKEVEGGNEIAISFGKKKQTIAVIISYDEYKRNKKRQLGTLKGKMKVIFNDNSSITDEELFSK